MRKYLILFAICLYSTISDAQNVGVGVSNPQNKLHVGGGFRLDTLTGVGGAGLVRHDANGVVYGIKFSGSPDDVLRGDGTFGAFNVNGAIGWLLNGNSGTNPAAHFLGTIDNVPFNVRVNNLRSGLIDPSWGNTGWGYQTLFSNTSGLRNTAIGSEALLTNVDASDNTAIGYNALRSNLNGIGNTTMGSGALKTGSGNYNTAVGVNALETSVGIWNSSFGAEAMKNNTGEANCAFGFKALHENNGQQNSAFGFRSLENNNAIGNSGFGFGALTSNQTGYYNSAVGNNSLVSNSSGYFNSALGATSLLRNTTGHDNTALGYSAMNKNSTASFNTSVGAFSMYSNSTGQQNTAMGYKAMEQTTGGWYNTATGFGALQGNTNSGENCAYGWLSLNNNSGFLANQNTAIGNMTLANNYTGNGNTALGFAAGYFLPNNVTNVTCIGNRTGWNTTSSNQINIGNFSVSWIGGQTGWFHYSDKRIKNDIKNDVPGLSFITRLKPITYHVDIDKQEEIANAGKIETNSELIKPVKKDWEGKYDVEKIKMTGFFAQDVEEAAKSINYSFSGVHNPKNGGLYSIDYSAFVVPLVKAVQEQQSIIEKQQKQIDDLLKRLEALEKK